MIQFDALLRISEWEQVQELSGDTQMQNPKLMLPGLHVFIVGFMMAAIFAESAFSQKLPGTTTVSGTTTTAISPDAPRLLLQLLPMHGDPLFTNQVARHSCTTFGNNYVLVGLKVRHRVTSLAGVDLFCAPLRADGTTGTAIFLPAMAPPEGTAQEVRCPSGQAVAGYQGMLDNSGLSPRHLRSVTLFCAKLNSNGLIEGASTKATPLGINSGIAFGPDMCSGGRAGREMRLKAAQIGRLPVTVGAWQLGCAQAARP